MIIVQKYGGATLATPEKIKSVAERIAKLKQKDIQIVAVVSAMGTTTNQLIQLAHQVSPNPSLRELDMLLSTGERVSMSLMSMALNDLGCKAISLTGSQAGILTSGSHINSKIIDVKAFRVDEYLKQNKTVVLAGFQGVNPETKEITTLGRGGSDTTAVAMAGYLKADRCEILKDVDGIYTADPKICESAKPIRHLNYDILLEMTYWGAKVLHYQSVELAKKNQVKLYVGPAAVSQTLIEEQGTHIQDSFQFENQKPIAINSHSSILKIKVSNEYCENQFSELFKQFESLQIGLPEIVCHEPYLENEHFLYLAGPNEILDLIQSYRGKNSFYQLEDDSLCSVSITFAHENLDTIKTEVLKTFESNAVHFIKLISSKLSLNFILEKSQRVKIIQALHNDHL